MALKDHLNKVEYFCHVVECKSFLQASYKIGISQPQLSRVIKQLENDLDKQLIIRRPSGIQLTLDGDTLYKASKSIIQSINSAENVIKFGSQSLTGAIRIGAYDSIARYFFPSFLKYLKNSQPKLKIYLETERSEILFKNVENNSLDISICVDHEFDSKKIAKKIIYTDSFGFYHHPSLSTEFLDNLIFFPGSMQIDRKEAEAFSKTYKFKSYFMSDNLETVKSLCEESVGIGLLPHRVAREAVYQGKLTQDKRKSRPQNLCPHNVILSYNKSNDHLSLETFILELTHFLSTWSEK